MTLPGIRIQYDLGGRPKKKRKERRAFSSKNPLHVTLRSEHARGKLSLLYPPHARYIRHLIPLLARKYAVRVYRFANVGNHLHLLLQAEDKKGVQAFFRVLTGLLARKITGAQKGRPFGTRFWEGLIYSRVITWGKAYLRACRYIDKNQRQAGPQNRPYQILHCLDIDPPRQGSPQVLMLPIL